MKSVAAIGLQSTGKSSLLNAMFGTDFQVHPAGGAAGYSERTVGPLRVIDTAPLDRAPIGRATLYLLVIDKDLTDVEFQAARRRAKHLAVVLNKADTFSPPQLRTLLRAVRGRLAGIVPPERVVASAADPVRIATIHRAGAGAAEQVVRLPPDVTDVVRLAELLLR